MKGSNKNHKLLSLHVYGILNKKLEKITKVSLDKEELIFEIDLDNYSGHLVLCDFYVKVDMPL